MICSLLDPTFCEILSLCFKCSTAILLSVSICLNYLKLYDSIDIELLSLPIFDENSAVFVEYSTETAVNEA